VTRAPRSTQTAARQADQAADQVLEWLRQQRGDIFDKAPDALEPDALLVGNQTTVGEMTPTSAESILDEEHKTEPTSSVSVGAEEFGRRDFGEGAQDVASLRSPTTVIERVEALAGAGAGPSTGTPSFGNAAAGVEETTSPLRVQAGARGGSEDPAPGDRNGVVTSALRLAHTAWLHHRLDVTGPAAALTDFQTAARGAGTIPWPFERDRMEEDLFHLLVAPPAPQRSRLSLAGARVLARQLGEAAELRHAAAVARVGHSRACPFDLHALVPVPSDTLLLGPDHPDGLAWLSAHWGTTQALRHVVLEPALPRRQTLPPDTAILRLSFWSADWTPWRALATVAARWPVLRFAVAPTYEPL
jgi:hypothetical protein